MKELECCVFCLKQDFDWSNNFKVDEDEAKPNIVKIFTQLFLRHVTDAGLLQNRSSSYKLLSFKQVLKKVDKSGVNLTPCSACTQIISKFNDLYGKIKCEEIQISWLLSKLANVMGQADQVPARVKQFQKSSQQLSAAADVIKELRTSLQRQCDIHYGAQFPRVLIGRVEPIKIDLDKVKSENDNSLDDKAIAQQLTSDEKGVKSLETSVVATFRNMASLQAVICLALFDIDKFRKSFPQNRCVEVDADDTLDNQDPACDVVQDSLASEPESDSNDETDDQLFEGKTTVIVSLVPKEGQKPHGALESNTLRTVYLCHLCRARFSIRKNWEAHLAKHEETDDKVEEYLEASERSKGKKDAPEKCDKIDKSCQTDKKFETDKESQTDQKLEIEKESQTDGVNQVEKECQTEDVPDEDDQNSYLCVECGKLCESKIEYDYHMLKQCESETGFPAKRARLIPEGEVDGTNNINLQEEIITRSPGLNEIEYVYVLQQNQPQHQTLDPAVPQFQSPCLTLPDPSSREDLAYSCRCCGGNHLQTHADPNSWNPSGKTCGERFIAQPIGVPPPVSSKGFETIQNNDGIVTPQKMMEPLPESGENSVQKSVRNQKRKLQTSTNGKTSSKFSCGQIYDNHLLTHADYSCSVCGKKFIDKEEMDKHFGACESKKKRTRRQTNRRN